MMMDFNKYQEKSRETAIPEGQADLPDTWSGW